MINRALHSIYIMILIRLWLVSLLTFSSISCYADEFVGDPEISNVKGIKVVAWNIEWFPGLAPNANDTDVAKHIATTQQALIELDPDIFIATEICDYESFAELCSVLPELEIHVVSRFRDLENGLMRHQQIAIASKFPAIAISWQPSGSNEPMDARGFAYAALQLPDKQGLLMVHGVHFKSNHGDAKKNALIRKHQTQQVLDDIAYGESAYAALPIAGWILAGDFNTNHDGQFPLCTTVEQIVAAGFHNTWITIPKEQRTTWHGRDHPVFDPTTFDYIFTKGLGVHKANMPILDNIDLISDHHPVVLHIPWGFVRP